MSTIAIDESTQGHQWKPANNERPMLLREIHETHHPQLTRDNIRYIVRRYCGIPTSSKPGQPLRCLLSVFNAALKEYRRDRIPMDRLEFKDRHGTWVSEKKLPSGIVRHTADLMYRDGLIRKPRLCPVDGKSGPRKFWHLEDMMPYINAYATPLAVRDKIRSIEELTKLHDDAMVNRREARLLGFKAPWLSKHSDIEDVHRRLPRKPALPLGRFIRGELRMGMAIGEKDSKRRMNEPWYRIGDLRDCIRARDNPPVPEGGRLVRDNITAELARVGINTNRHTVRRLIQKGTTGGGQITTYTKDFKKHKSWWMKCQDREKIRVFGSVGNRIIWLDGEDWYPLYGEALEISGYSENGLRHHVPREFGGVGKPCDHLKDQLLRTRRADIPHRRGDKLLVAAGNDLRDMALGRTGVRPEAPAKPPGMESEAPATASNGNGHAQIDSTAQDAHRRASDQGSVPLSARDLATKWGTDLNATKVALQRFRDKYPDNHGILETKSAGRRDGPRFLYRESAVIHMCDDLPAAKPNVTKAGKTA